MPGYVLRGRWTIRGRPGSSCLEKGCNGNRFEEETKEAVWVPPRVRDERESGEVSGEPIAPIREPPGEGCPEDGPKNPQNPPQERRRAFE